MTDIEQLPIHTTDPVERRVGTACGITLEIRRKADGLALVAFPTTEGQTIIMNSSNDDLKLISLIGETMLWLLINTAPLLTGEHFRPHGTATKFGL